MITDLFKIFSDHEQIDIVIRILRVFLDCLDKILLYFNKESVNDIVIGNDRSCLCQILSDEGFNDLMDHHDGFLTQIFNIFHPMEPLHIENNIGGIAGNFTDALHVSDHL